MLLNASEWCQLVLFTFSKVLFPAGSDFLKSIQFESALIACPLLDIELCIQSVPSQACPHCHQIIGFSALGKLKVLAMTVQKWFLEHYETICWSRRANKLPEIELQPRNPQPLVLSVCHQTVPRLQQMVSSVLLREPSWCCTTMSWSECTGNQAQRCLWS